MVFDTLTSKLKLDEPMLVDYLTACRVGPRSGVRVVSDNGVYQAEPDMTPDSATPSLLRIGIAPMRSLPNGSCAYAPGRVIPGIF
jgi:hypothetical protein